MARWQTAPSGTSSASAICHSLAPLPYPAQGSTRLALRLPPYRAGRKALATPLFRADAESQKGIEPSYAAWEAAVLPLNYARNRIFLGVWVRFGYRFERCDALQK